MRIINRSNYFVIPLFQSQHFNHTKIINKNLIIKIWFKTEFNEVVAIDPVPLLQGVSMILKVVNLPSEVDEKK